LRQLDLQFALVAPCALPEDLQNEADAVQDPATKRCLQVALLGGRKFVVEDDQTRAGFTRGGHDLLDLARTGKMLRVGAVAPAAHDCAAFDARARGEQLEFFEAFGGVARTEVEAHQHGLDSARLLAARWTFQHRV